ncbi:MAG: amino acid ABC transporter permease [Christensenellales bacterium]
MNFFERIGNILSNYYLWILKGVGYTMLVAVVGTLAGLLIGVLIGMYRTLESPKNKFLRVLKKVGDFILSAYVEIFRGTPMMVQAMVIFWGFALLNDGATLDVTVSGLIIVSINTGAYMAEIVRGGIISVDKGQFEGAQAIGMTHSQTMWNVVLPQALRNIMPSVANEFVINIKDTSVLNVIGFTELFFYAKTIVLNTYQTFETYLVVAVVYFILTFTITRILRLVEKKMDGKKNYTVLGSQNMDADSIVRENNVLGK